MFFLEKTQGGKWVGRSRQLTGTAGVMNGTPLPLSLGEVSERSEDGEGKRGCNTLSVTCGDSSPKGRAKGLR